MFERKKTYKKEKKKESKKEVEVEDNATKAKRLSKDGLTTKEVAEVMNITRYEASKLIKGR